MTKKILKISITTALCAVLLACVTACKPVDDAKEFFNYVKYPDVYSIEYSVIPAGGGTPVTVLKSVDSDGDIFFKNGNEETYYIAEGSSYAVFEKKAEGFVKSNVNISFAHAEAQTITFKQLVEKSLEHFLDRYTQGEDTTFIERECYSYTGKFEIANMAVNYEMLIDKATGICLSFKSVNFVDGEEKSRDGFECVLFITEGVDVTAPETIV